MNGRMYDPIIGRMLSPDNYVQSPYNTQSYNRYSYVLNNPLKYTDPTGEITWWDVGAGLMIAGGVILTASGAGAPFGIPLIGSGVAHFGRTLQMSHNQGVSWNQASSYVGLDLSVSVTPDWGDNNRELSDFDKDFLNYETSSNPSTEFVGPEPPKWNGKYFQGSQDEADKMLIESSILFGVETRYYHTDKGFLFSPIEGKRYSAEFSPLDYSILQLNSEKGYFHNQIDKSYRYHRYDKVYGNLYVDMTNVFSGARVISNTHVHPNNNMNPSSSDNFNSKHIGYESRILGWNGSIYIFGGNGYWK